MNDLITLLATATDARLMRFTGMIEACSDFIERRKQTYVFWTIETNLPAIVEAAVASAVTLQRVHDPGREEWYEILHQGSMEGWASKPRASAPPYRP